LPATIVTAKMCYLHNASMTSISFLQISLIECLSTDDATGSDSLEARFDDNRAYTVSFGEFSAGDIKTTFDTLIVPVASRWLAIYDADPISDDDLIGEIDLGTDLDTERDVVVSNGSGSYRFVFTAFSSSDKSSLDDGRIIAIHSLRMNDAPCTAADGQRLDHSSKQNVPRTSDVERADG